MLAKRRSPARPTAPAERHHGAEPIRFVTHPDHHRHWKLHIAAPIARLALDVVEDGGLRPDYRSKLNSYDLSVDLELADAIERGSASSIPRCAP